MTFALITQSERGFRHLNFEGYRFGVRTHRADGTVWRCTALSSLANRTQSRCNATVHTKIIGNHEMVRKVKPIHTCVKKS